MSNYGSVIYFCYIKKQNGINSSNQSSKKSFHCLLSIYISGFEIILEFRTSGEIFVWSLLPLNQHILLFYNTVDILTGLRDRPLWT